MGDTKIFYTVGSDPIDSIKEEINELSKTREITEVWLDRDFEEAARLTEQFKNTIIDRIKKQGPYKPIALVMVSLMTLEIKAESADLINDLQNHISVIETLCDELPELNVIFQSYYIGTDLKE